MTTTDVRVSDPITTEVIANALKSIVHEMDAAIERTAMSIIIREQHDFGMSIVDHRGWVVAGTAFSGTTLARYGAEHPIYPGDVMLFNDPYIAGGEISHLGDTMLAVPIFWDGQLLAWGIAWGHHMDLGADAPASMPTRATEIFHEGIQIPPVKLYDRGVINEALVAVIARNSRTPDMMVGDLLALSAAGKIAEQRIHDLCRKFGLDAVRGTFETLLDRARGTMRRLIELLPEQRFEFEDYLDYDGMTDEPLTIHFALERRGEKLYADFTGTSPQCEGPVNFPLNPYSARINIYNVLRMAAGDRVDVDPEADANQGVQDLIEIIMPEGCFLNPTRPAPVSLRHLSMVRVTEAIQGVLAQIFPDAIPATHNGSLNCYSLLGRGRAEEDRWLCFEVMAAGSGGRPKSDGIDAFSWNTRLKNAPVEFMETVYPVRVEQYSLRPGSSGPGEHRGGYGMIRAIRTLRPATLYFLDDRHRTQPWGLHGGGPAAPNDAFVVRASGQIVQLPSKFDDMKLEPGDMFVMRTGGGGGWGDPFDRDPQLVRRDVLCSLLTVDQAEERYGVVIDAASNIDVEATAQRRKARKATPSWIERGTAQRTPGPREFWPLDVPPVPWLLV